MTKKQHWVDKYLVPLKPCDKSSAIEKARQYPDPQSAWDAWDDGAELLWNLKQCGEKDTSKLVLCACDIAERVLPIFEEERPDDDRPRKAIEAARNFVENPSDENREAAGAAYAAAYAVRCASACASACAAYAAAYAAHADADTAYAAAYAAYAAASAVRLAARAAEKKAQAGIVRKYFPVSPFVKKEVTNDDNVSSNRNV